MQNPQSDRERFEMMQENREFGPKGNRNKDGLKNANETAAPTFDGETPPEKPDAEGFDGQDKMVPPELNNQKALAY